MKKIFALSTTLVVAVLIGFACKKSSTTSNTSTTTTSTTGTTTSNNTGGAANTATYTTSGGAVSCTILSTSCGTTYMYGSTSVPTQVGQISVAFSAAPAAGNFNVTAGSPTASQAVVAVGGNYATGGTITLSVVNGKNKVVFNNVVCSTSPTYTLNGNFSCP